MAAQQQAIDGLLKTQFRPEFINRLDDIIIFQNLGPAEIKQIVTLQLELVRKRLAEQEISLSFSDKLVKHLAEAGYDQVFGARPLKRLIQNEVLDQLASQIIEGKLQAGDKALIDWTGKQIKIS